MLQRKPTLNIRRIAGICLILIVSGTLTVVASIQAFATPTIEFTGPMRDRMIVEENGGVPIAVVRRRAAVMQALESPQVVEWAGEYTEGDGLGENVALAIAPDAGIAATWHGCLGLYGSNEGNVNDLGNGRLAFQFNRRNGNDHGMMIGTFPSNVTLVRWGQRRYLLAEDQMIGFVNAMHRGWEPRTDGYGLFLLAKGDETLPAPGLPTLPEKYLAYVRSTPFDVRLTSIEQIAERGSEEYPECKYRVHFSLPAGEQVPKGLEFSVKQPDRVADYFKVVESAGTEASAEGTLSGKCLSKENRPTTDWVLTSGAYLAKKSD